MRKLVCSIVATSVASLAVRQLAASQFAASLSAANLLAHVKLPQHVVARLPLLAVAKYNSAAASA